MTCGHPYYILGYNDGSDRVLGRQHIFEALGPASPAFAATYETHEMAERERVRLMDSPTACVIRVEHYAPGVEPSRPAADAAALTGWYAVISRPGTEEGDSDPAGPCTYPEAAIAALLMQEASWHEC
jgi:hypothetical protein